MGSVLALAEARKLQAAIIRRGAKCTIELMAGRPWTGDQWYSRKYILFNHHTAGPMTGLTPSYAICRKGRSDVPGPLCNGYGGRDLVFRIVTMGLANHPGAGGPLTIDGVTLPKDSARISSFGIEWEHNGLSTWPANMLPFMGQVGAGVLDYLSRRTINSIEHKTWTSRKIDRNPNFSKDGKTGQALITKHRGALTPPKPPEDDDMPITDADAQKIASAVWFRDVSPGTEKLNPAWTTLWNIHQALLPEAFSSSAAAALAKEQGVVGVPTSRTLWEWAWHQTHVTKLRDPLLAAIDDIGLELTPEQIDALAVALAAKLQPPEPPG